MSGVESRLEEDIFVIASLSEQPVLKTLQLFFLPLLHPTPVFGIAQAGGPEHSFIHLFVVELIIIIV